MWVLMQMWVMVFVLGMVVGALQMHGVCNWAYAGVFVVVDVCFCLFVVVCLCAGAGVMLRWVQL